MVFGTLRASRNQGVGAPSGPPLQPHVPAGLDSPDDTAPVARRPAVDWLESSNHAPQCSPERPRSGLHKDPLGRPGPASSRPPVESGTGIVARLTSTTATSAGGIVVRYVDSIPQFVVGRRKRERDNQTWTLPKGTPIPGESLEETALREVREETGLVVRILGPLGSIEYTFVQRRQRIYKTVHYFMMESTGGGLDEHDHEFEEVRWVSFGEAPALLSFETERSLVELAATHLPEEGSLTGASHPL